MLPFVSFCCRKVGFLGFPCACARGPLGVETVGLEQLALCACESPCFVLKG